MNRREFVKLAAGGALSLPSLALGGGCQVAAPRSGPGPSLSDGPVPHPGAKLDVFNHILPKRYFEKMLEIAPGHKDIGKRVRNIPALYDLAARFKAMDPFEGYRQFLTIPTPPIESFCGPESSPELARIANEGMAELVGRYPDRFVGFAAALPLNNVEATLVEIDHALTKLGARTSDEDLARVLESLKKRPCDYFKMFYADTAIYGAPSAVKCGLEFFGMDHVLFASDMPFDPEKGPMYIRETIHALDSLGLAPEQKDQIYAGNARRLLRL